MSTEERDAWLEAVGQAIRWVREERTELSQEALGARAGLHRTYVSDVERGQRNPTVWTLRRLAEPLSLRPRARYSVSRKRGTEGTRPAGPLCGRPPPGTAPSPPTLRRGRLAHQPASAGRRPSDPSVRLGRAIPSPGSPASPRVVADRTGSVDRAASVRSSSATGPPLERSRASSPPMRAACPSLS